MSDKCVRCDTDNGTVDHFDNMVCDDCLTPYEGRRMEKDMVIAEFYDKARQTISGLLDIIRQEVYLSMNRIPECDQWVIDSAMFEEGELRDDIAKGLAGPGYKPRNSHSVANETYRKRRRLDIVKMVEGMNKHWVDNATYSGGTYKIGWFEDKIEIPYPEGCYPITTTAALSTPFVLVDGWVRPQTEEVSE